MTLLTPAQRSNLLPLTARIYPFWRARSLTWLSGQPFSLAREERLFLGLCEPLPGERWLDLGTSSGFYAGVLARRGCWVEALDLSPAMLRVAARREPSQRIRWHRLNAEASGLPPGTYGGITIGATLNETARPALLLQEAGRLLAPGGRLWLMYVAQVGGAGQRLLSALGGLTFPDLAWIERQLPALRLVHLSRFGCLEFALWVKAACQCGHPSAPAT